MRITVLICISLAAAQAQTPRAALSGRITDPSGAVVPAVTVVALQSDNGRQIAAVSDRQGNYALRAPAGEYTLAASQPGFEPWSRAHIELAAGAVLQVDIQLEIAAMAQQVTVKAPVSGQGTGSPAPKPRAPPPSPTGRRLKTVL